LLFAVLLTVAGLVPASASAADEYRTGMVRWRAAEGGFAGWALDGASVAADGALRLSDGVPDGMVTSPPAPTGFGALEAIPSWSVDAPAGGWIDVELRARDGDHWSGWYKLGVWSAESTAVERHSIKGQGDGDGAVATDTLTLRRPADAVQVRIALHAPGGESPRLRAAAVALSTAGSATPSERPGNPALWGRRLDLPSCSQMVYPDGGRVWCSPTSTSMILGYWRPDGGPCEPRVRAAVAGVYDATYRGHGNWPFNAAYAATFGLEGYVARFSSLADVEPWIAAGVPVAFSFAFKFGELANAPIASTTGHLAVIVGFDGAGNPIVHDPAAASDAGVPRVYRRAQLESVWLRSSGGTVYLIYPPDLAVPTL
jgi:hypothetical protein